MGTPRGVKIRSLRPVSWCGWGIHCRRESKGGLGLTLGAPVENRSETQLRNERKGLQVRRGEVQSLGGGRGEKIPALGPGKGADLVPELGALRAWTRGQGPNLGSR